MLGRSAPANVNQGRGTLVGGRNLGVESLQRVTECMQIVQGMPSQSVFKNKINDGMAVSCSSLSGPIIMRHMVLCGFCVFFITCTWRRRVQTEKMFISTV